MRRIVQDALRAAYLSLVTTEVIAASYKLSARHVWRFWAAEKAAGRLPNIARPTAPVVEADDDDEDFDRCVTPARNECASVALLTALQRAHGDEPWRRFDDMPRQTLQMESNGFPPSAARLRVFLHTKDSYIRALDARRNTHVGR